MFLAVLCTVRLLSGDVQQVKGIEVTNKSVGNKIYVQLPVQLQDGARHYEGYSPENDCLYLENPERAAGAEPVLLKQPSEQALQLWKTSPNLSLEEAEKLVGAK